MADLHEQIRSLHTQIEALEARFGEVCGQYAEITTELAPFLSRYRDEVVRYHKALLMAQREVADVRTYLGDTSSKHHGEGRSPLDEFLKREERTVEQQYDRVWGGDDSGSVAALNSSMAPASDEVQTLYSKAVAKLHPDLSSSTAERRSRIAMFNQVNRAYLRRDVNTLRMAVEATTPQSNLPALVSDQTVKEMRNRIYDLEEIIARIETQTFDYHYGDVAKLHAHAQAAEAEGKDFIAELSEEIQRALRRTVEELATLKQNLEQT
jgi:Mg2+ and Co2+ transporter CorA